MKRILLFSFALVLQLCAFGQTRFWDDYGKTFNVNGGAGIEQFVTAILQTKPDEWSTDPIYDKRNGYFEYHEEGSGSVTYNVCYWNRKDGKKLVLLSYYTSDFGERVNPQSSAWGYYSSFQYGENDTDIFNAESGFRAYLYDEAKKRLVPMATPPFNGFPNPVNNHYFLQLPREGKDIIVRETVDLYESVYHTLKWNGLTFDFKKEGNVPTSFFVTSNKVDIRTEPNGKVVFSTENNKEYSLDILKIENGWCLIHDNKIYPNGDDDGIVELKGSTTGQYWIKAAALGAHGRSESLLRTTPDMGGKVLMKVTEDDLVEPIELRGEWVKVRDVKTKKEGWMLKEELCSNPLTTCV